MAQVSSEVSSTRFPRVLCHKTQDLVVVILDGNLVAGRFGSSEEPTKLLENGTAISVVEFSPDGSLLCATQDKKILMWNVDGWGQSFQVELKKRILCGTFAPDGSSFLAGDRDGDVWSVAIGKPSEAPSLKFELLSMVTNLKCSPDGKSIVSTERDEKIRVAEFDFAYNIRGYCMGHTEFSVSLDLPSNERMISGGMEGALRLWDLTSFKCLSAISLVDPNSDPSRKRKAPEEGTNPTYSVLHIQELSESDFAVLMERHLAIFIVNTSGDSLKVVDKVELSGVPFAMDVDRTGQMWVLTTCQGKMIQTLQKKGERWTLEDANDFVSRLNALQKSDLDDSSLLPIPKKNTEKFAKILKAKK